jgi:hypothetical protein
MSEREPGAISRHRFVQGAGALAMSGAASAYGIDAASATGGEAGPSFVWSWEEYIDVDAVGHQANVDRLYKAGYRIISLGV